MTTNPKWRKFERLVTAIHRALAHGAQVDWDCKINGRQFDVVMRFTVGSYNYLTVIECRDTKTDVPVGDVEAFVTKSRDAKADKAVMVSSSGFQSGAREVADRHGIELFSVSYIEGLPTQLLSDELYPALQIYELAFQDAESRDWIYLREDRNLPVYLAHNLKITVGGKEWTLDRVIQSLKNQLLRQASSNSEIYTLEFPHLSTAFIPYSCTTHSVSALKFRYRITSFRALRTPGLDPFLLSGSYTYTNIATGKVIVIPKGDVKLGFDTVLQPGHFYFNANLEFSYYCISLEGNTAHMALVESYQHGILIQAEFTQSIEYAHQYTEITDPGEINRLRNVGANVLEAVYET